MPDTDPVAEYRAKVMKRFLRRAIYLNEKRFGGHPGGVVFVHWPDRKRGPGAWHS